MIPPLILHGDCRDVMAKMEGDSIDAIVTDPPYGLEFMGKGWDAPWKHGFSSPGYGDAERLARPSFTSSRNPICTACGRRQRTWKSGPAACACSAPTWDRRQADEMRAFQAWAEQWAREALRVAKPGAHLVAFGGTRTYHRLTCAIEDAGWEIRDSLMWLYGSGFPKSKNLDGAWQGWGTALKPAYEPIILARKPLVGTVTANVERYGTGALNIDGCRVGFQSDTDKSRAKPQGATTSRKASGDGGLAAGYRDTPRGEFVAEQSALGRWPANVVLDETAGAMLDAQAGPCGAASPVKGTEPSAVTDGVYAARARVPGAFHADSGGPSRFFYCAKASPSERNSGVEGKNTHPTVKPVALMRYLVKLVTPPGGLVLDPFCGSGTTGVACGAEGAGFVGIEKELDFVEIARKRIGGIA